MGTVRNIDLTKRSNWPSFGHETGAISGLDPWTTDEADWSAYGAEDVWPGTSEYNPFSIPGPIGDYGDYSLGYGPSGAGPGLGPDGLYPFNVEDLGGDPSGLADLFGDDSAYGLQFDPMATAGRSWRPTYQVTGPGAEGYHISSDTAHQGFPWIRGQAAPEVDPDQCGPGETWNGIECVPSAWTGTGCGPGETWNGVECVPTVVNTVDLNTVPTLQEQCELSGGTWDGFECDQSVSGIQSSEKIVRPMTNLPEDWLGDILPRQDAIPFQPQAFEDLSVVPVGTDPLSQLANAVQASMMTTGGVAPTPLAGNIEQTLQDILTGRGQGAEAVSPLGEQVGETASEIIARGGQMPLDVRRRAMEIESARSPLDTLRRAQLSQGQAALAGRNLLGQGPEVDYMQRLETKLAPEYARAGQLIELAEREREEQRFQSAMELSARTANEQAQLRESRLANAMQQATGMSMEQSRNLLATVASVTERQQMLNDVAISSLDRNMEWNQFIAEFNLERHQVLEAIQTGRLAALLPLLQQYMAGVTLSATGFVEG
jgi:hypothetical protein